jgi:hypothetical protein
MLWKTILYINNEFPTIGGDLKLLLFSFFKEKFENLKMIMSFVLFKEYIINRRIFR